MNQAQAFPVPSVSLPQLAYRGIPVITTESLAQAYEVEAGSIRKNFSCNKERFTEGKHYFSISGQELNTFRLRVTESNAQLSPKTRFLTLWTERGAARHAKMLNSDRAWDMFELLEETFFRAVKTDLLENPEQLTPAHRSELKGIVDAKLSTYPASVQGKARSEIWTRFNRHFRIAEYAQLPAERMAEARDYLIELEVKALKALPSATPSTPPVIEDRRIPDAMAELRKLVMHCGRVRNIVHMECHPGGVSLSLSVQEQEAYYALQGLYQTAVDNMYAATHALDACLKLRAIYPARG